MWPYYIHGWLWQESRVHLEFSNWLSLVILAVLLLGLLAWITYVALSIRTLKRHTRHLVTKTELAEEFRKFKQQLANEQ